MIETLQSESSRPVDTPGATAASLREMAKALEASFLAEMLRHAGVARPPGTGNGGAGETAFAGLLVDAYADAIVERGGIGLAQVIVEALAAEPPP